MDRRSRSRYPLNERHHGTSYRERRLSVKCVKFVTIFSPLLLIPPVWARPVIASCVPNTGSAFLARFL